MAQQENEVVRYAYDLFDSKGWMPVRQKQKWKGNTSYLRKGVADIICCVSGRYLAVECKTPDGKQSDDQKVFERGIKKKGNGIYVIVRSKAEVHQLISELKRLRLT